MEHLKEKIRFLTELIKMLIICIIATMTGLITLIYYWNTFTGRLFILGFSSGIAIVVELVVLYYLCKETLNLIDKLKTP
jgi:hypothetical protein